MVPAHREPQTLLIDQSIVQQVKRKSPKVLFIPTASEEYYVINYVDILSCSGAI